MLVTGTDLAKPTNVQDEVGRNWYVYPEDAAYSLCHSLTKLGVKDIVLPARAIMSGGVEGYNVDDNINDITEEALSNGAVARLYARLIRIRDCVNWIKEHSDE